MMQRVRGEASACLLVAPLSLHMSGSGHPHTEQSAPCILQALVVAAEAQIASLKPRAAQFYRSVEVFLCLQMRCQLHFSGAHVNPMATDVHVSKLEKQFARPSTVRHRYTAVSQRIPSSANFNCFSTEFPRDRSASRVFRWTSCDACSARLATTRDSMVPGGHRSPSSKWTQVSPVPRGSQEAQVTPLGQGCQGCPGDPAKSRGSMGSQRPRGPGFHLLIGHFAPFCF